jgi:hypothetical protein
MALVITRIGVHDPPESMFKINWTECSRSTGIGVQDPPERAAPQWNSAAGAWLRGVLERRPVRLATVALANKMARIAWALMTRNEVYRPKGSASTAAAAAG